MFAKVKTAAVSGIESCTVTVEVDLSPGLPSFSTVGLPDTSVKESKDRVVAALKNSGFDFPSKKITVNLAPAEIKKEGAAFDLPIAIGILAAKEVVKKQCVDNFYFIGELALNGKVRPVKGVLSIALGVRKSGLKKIILPDANANEAAVVRDVEIYPVHDLAEVVAFLNGEREIERYSVPVEKLFADSSPDALDFSEVKGQIFAKRALEVAAAGGHNVIMIGSPGSGKTMMAKRLPSILPPLSFEESIETTRIHSVAGLLKPGIGLLPEKPFRSPHHTISDIALIGGGQYPKPGEVSLAHNGVLFLDELPEFHRDVLEVLRQPLEDNVVTISRARQSLVFPSCFMLIGSMNPCPCGNFGHPEKECLCSPYQIQKYRSRISGPLLDRIDIQLEVPALKMSELTQESGLGEPSSEIRNRVLKARAVQKERFSAPSTGAKIYCNAQMTSKMLKQHCKLGSEAKDILKAAIEKLGFSGRAYDRVIKVSRTIADLEGSDEIGSIHISEAIQYRGMDRLQ